MGKCAFLAGNVCVSCKIPCGNIPPVANCELEKEGGDVLKPDVLFQM